MLLSNQGFKWSLRVAHQATIPGQLASRGPGSKHITACARGHGNEAG